MTATRSTTARRRAPGLPTTDLTVASPKPRVSVVDHPGSTLVAEGRSLVEQHRWKDACRCLRAAVLLTEEAGASAHTEAQELLAVAATYGRDRRAASTAVAALRSEPEPSVESLNALATVALARHEFEAADLLARKAVETDPNNAESWGNLSASYAGLGWFRESEECLDRAESLELPDHRRWHIGRAINRWSLVKTPAGAVTAVLFFFIGLLSLAIGFTVPFLMREIRLTQLTDRMAILAADAWKSEHRVRIGHAVAVVATVAIWALLLALR